MRLVALFAVLTLIALAIQTTASRWLPLSALVPDLVLVLAVDLGLRHRRALAPIMAFAMGYAMDAFSGSQLGVNTFAVTLTYLVAYEVGVHTSASGAGGRRRAGFHRGADPEPGRISNQHAVPRARSARGVVAGRAVAGDRDRGDRAAGVSIDRGPQANIGAEPATRVRAAGSREEPERGALALLQQQQAVARDPPHRAAPRHPLRTHRPGPGGGHGAALLPADHPAQGIRRTRRPQPHPHSSPAGAARPGLRRSSSPAGRHPALIRCGDGARGRAQR